MRVVRKLGIEKRASRMNMEVPFLQIIWDWLCSLMWCVPVQGWRGTWHGRKGSRRLESEGPEQTAQPPAMVSEKQKDYGALWDPTSSDHLRPSARRDICRPRVSAHQGGAASLDKGRFPASSACRFFCWTGVTRPQGWDRTETAAHLCLPTG